MSKGFIETWEFIDKYMTKFFERKFVKSKEKCLFHFTNFNSFLGMIRNQEIWAFHTKFMNDPTESGLFFSCLTDRVNEKMKQNSDEEKVYIDHISHIISLFSKRDKYNPDETGHFIFSLSEIENSVGLWREYAGNGKGLAIKLNRENLIESVNSSESHLPLTCFIYKIEYFNRDNFNDFVNEFFEFYKEALNEARNKLEDMFNDEAFHEAVLLNLYSISALIKHEAYAEEKEHRLIVRCNLTLSDIEYMGGENCIRPYIKLPFLNQQYYKTVRGSDRLIEGLWLGCNSHPNAENSVRLLWDTQKAKLRSRNIKFKLRRRIFKAETTENSMSQTHSISIYKSSVPIQAK